MAAVEYAVVHDDGLNIERLDDADMLLVGVSRTSKLRHLCIWVTGASK